MIPTARVQRGSSETARCASTGIVPATSPLFSILLYLHPLNFFIRRHQLISDLHHQLEGHIGFL